MKRLIYGEKLEKDSYNYDLYSIDFARDLFNLQQDMINAGYYVDIFTASDFWMYYSDAYCATFLGYTKGEFNEDHLDMAKHPVYIESGYDYNLLDLTEEKAKEIKEDADKLLSLFEVIEKEQTFDSNEGREYKKLLDVIYNKLNIPIKQMTLKQI